MARRIRGKNEGSLHQRPNGTWRAQLSVDGRRISKGFKTKAEAQEWLRSTQTQVERGFDYHAGKITLAEYLSQWLESHRVSLRPKTADQYQRVIEKHILPHLGDIQVKNLRITRVEQFYSELVQAGMGVRTVRIVHTILHKALEKALRYGLVMSNPAHGAALPRYKHGEMQVLDESQVTQFLVAAQDSPYQALYHLALTTGMRQGELLGLKWTDLQWHSGALLVQRQLQDIRGQGTIYQEPKTRAGRRTIKLGEGTLQALRLHRERQQVLKASAGSRWKENDLIFPSKVGTPRDPSNLRLDFNRILEKAGLPKIRFHDLRHTAASLMLNHGVPVIVASKRLGHSKPSITLDIYGHLYQEMQDEVARKMDELVSPVPVEFQAVVHQPAPAMK
jgi:integrase